MITCILVNSFFRKNCSIYEIYPQSETPHLTQIAHLDFGTPGNLPGFLVAGTVIWYSFSDDLDFMVFIVWDYRLIHSIKFYIDCSGSKNKVYFILSEALKLASNTFVGR